MNYNIEPWHWLILGLILMVLEIFIPSFTIFWFGLAAVVVSGLVWLMPTLPVAMQIFIWVVLSVIVMVLWFKFAKPALSKDLTNAGLSREATIGQVGMVIQILPEHNEAVVRFPMPVLGADEWTCRILASVAVGDRVTVTDILGNQLVVQPHQTK
ncbi:NfeD family protein [Acinetobacter sp. A3.8]|uniref:NfeD family protein n=1 Tax=Acinetobacter sedimenti TaxID=2919922 RepID=A0A9X1WZI5_9GAMM|nr:NfeD family protein [Acinetobacter sedimenti]MCJ8147468.1 NfeD family protein [Acinetobacter sedimenti]